MAADHTKAEALARTLHWLCDNRYVPGLLPTDVREAAELLVTQEKALIDAGIALAAKRHTVTATASWAHPGTVEFKAMFVMADPRTFFTRHLIDYHRLEYGDRMLFESVVRHQVSMAQAQHRDELLQVAAPVFAKAIEELEKEPAR